MKYIAEADVRTKANVTSWGLRSLIGKVCIYCTKWYFMLKMGTNAPNVLSSSRPLVMVISSQSGMGVHVVST